jgi:hypothetical protein
VITGEGSHSEASAHASSTTVSSRRCGLTIGCRGCGALHAFGWMEVLRVGPAPLTLVSLGAPVQVSVRRTRRGDELSREEFPAEASMA